VRASERACVRVSHVFMHQMFFSSHWRLLQSTVSRCCEALLHIQLFTDMCHLRAIAYSLKADWYDMFCDEVAFYKRSIKRERKNERGTCYRFTANWWRWI